VDALTAAGYAVEEAVDGLDAVKRFAAARRPIDLVLLDLMMPRLDGLETLSELRRLRPGLPIVLISGYGAADLANRAADVAVDGFLQKPFSIHQLVAVVRQAIARRPPRS
ncbi:MAG: response regulator, partial [Planctomycetia bacterium]